MMNQPPRPWRAAEFIVHYVYLSTMLLNGGIFVGLPHVARLPYEEYKILFGTLVALALVSFPAAFYVYRKYVSQTALEHIRMTTGEGKACSVFKVGAILLTCLGDFSGVAGASFFTFTRDTNGLAIFIASWGAQYALTAFWVSRGRRYFESLAYSSSNLKDSGPFRSTM